MNYNELLKNAMWQRDRYNSQWGSAEMQREFRCPECKSRGFIMGIRTYNGGKDGEETYPELVTKECSCMIRRRTMRRNS